MPPSLEVIPRCCISWPPIVCPSTVSKTGPSKVAPTRVVPPATNILRRVIPSPDRASCVLWLSIFLLLFELAGGETVCHVCKWGRRNTQRAAGFVPVPSVRLRRGITRGSFTDSLVYRSHFTPAPTGGPFFLFWYADNPWPHRLVESPPRHVRLHQDPLLRA